MVKLALHLCANIARITPQWDHHGLRGAARAWIDWPAISKELLVQGRIWDFKDFYVATIAAFSNSGDTMFFGPDNIRHSMIDDWILEEGDESTDLALLDMLLEPAQLRSYFPDEAKSRAQAIISHSPKAMRSRAFIRWILANTADAFSGEKKGDADLWLASKTHLRGFSGMVWDTGDVFLPGIYVPRSTENPGWVAPDLLLGLNGPLQLALNLAKELKDYNAQVACYKMLIFQSQEPTQLFQELAHLQKSVQGDKKGHLETLLSSYLVCKDRPGKERLLQELEQTDDWGDTAVLRDGLTYWARDFIERAVKRSLQGPKSTARLRNPANFYMDKGLPLEAERFTWQNTEKDRPPPTRDYERVNHVREVPVSPSRRPVQVYEQQRINPYSRPSSPYEGHVPRPERRLPAPRGAEVLVERREREEAERRQEEEEIDRARKELQALRERREREREAKNQKLAADLDRAKKELQALKEEKEREARDKRDRETRERLERAEQRLRDQEEISAKQLEEMKRRDSEMKRLEQDFKRTKERQELEARTQQDRELRERLERTELSLRDQTERLRRAEDRSHRDWLTDRDHRRKGNTRGKLIRGRGGNRFRAMSSASSESYYSDTSPSRDDESSSEDTSLRTRRKNTVISSDSEEVPDRETRVKRRVRSIYEVGSDPVIDEADHQDGDDARSHKQNTCTDLVLYREAQDLSSHDARTSPASQPGEARVGSRGRSTTGPVGDSSETLSNLSSY